MGIQHKVFLPIEYVTGPGFDSLQLDMQRVMDSCLFKGQRDYRLAVDDIRQHFQFLCFAARDIDQRGA